MKIQRSSRKFNQFQGSFFKKTTYLWIVTNKKNKKRKGKIQLVDGSKFFVNMRKNLGDKGKEISDENRQEILETYLKFEENFPTISLSFSKTSSERSPVDFISSRISE